MINGKQFKMVTDKFMSSPTVQNARVQICLPNGEKKIRFSPHQIAFHMRHPKNTFILVKSLASGLSYLYEGNKIEELAACGLALDACCSELDACCLLLESLGA
jgi:hypothetical protein